VKKFRMLNRKKKVLQRAMKCQSGLLEPDETNLLGDAQGQKRKKKKKKKSGWKQREWHNYTGIGKSGRWEYVGEWNE
jgi:hypothetical protein